MLKLVWALRCGSPRLGQRSSSRCIPNHQMISACSSAATATQAKNDEVSQEKSAPVSKARNKSKHAMVELVFDSLSELENPSQNTESQKIKMVQDLLAYVHRVDYISPFRAEQTVDTLRRWTRSGKIETSHFESNPKYITLQKIIRDNSIEKLTNVPSEKKHNVPLGEFRELEQSYSNVRTMATAQAIKILSGLAATQKRDKPLLMAIAANISQSATTLSIKNIADILYSVAILSFPDEVLLRKLCSLLQSSLKAVEQSAVLGSIVTSLGMLRYRDTALLDMISKWFVKHKNVVRTQDLRALIMTNAIVEHKPSNVEVLFEELISTLKETDMIESSEWLDFVWSLTVSDRVTSEQLESVLDKKFIGKLMDGEILAPVKQRKLLNINAAARLSVKNYKGCILSEDCGIVDKPMARSQSKKDFVKAITNALINLFPSNDHFRTNVVTGTGFLLDVEFFLDKKGAPLPLNEVENHTDAMGIAVVANSYHDYCLGDKTLLGPVQLHKRLLRAKGYRLLEISHEEYHVNDKLLTRITYINDRLKSFVK